MVAFAEELPPPSGESSEAVPPATEEVRPPSAPFGPINVDMNRKTEYYPNGMQGPENISTLSYEQLRSTLSQTFSYMYDRAIIRFRESFDRLQRGKAAHGKPLDRLPEYRASLREQMRDFDTVMTDLMRHVFKLDEVQRGAAKITGICQHANNYFWDIVQDHPGFAPDHPLFKSENWRNWNMSIPGAYTRDENGERRLAAMSLPHMNRYRRTKSGETERFAKKPSEEFWAESNVDARYRGKVVDMVKEKYEITSDLELGRLRWEEKEKGNEDKGFAHVVEVTRDEEFWRGKEQPGSGRKGLFLIEGNFDEPEKAEVVYIDYDEVDDMMALCLGNPHFNRLVTKEGYFNRDFIDSFAPIKRQAESIAANDRDWKFYKQDKIAYLKGTWDALDQVVTMMEGAGFIDDAALSALNDPTPSGADTHTNLKTLVDIQITAGNEDGIKRILSTFCKGYKDRVGPDWWNSLKGEIATW